MDANIIILAVLFFSSAIMFLTLMLAWQHFGRERYVLLWALSYGAAMMQWASNGVGFVFKSYPLMFVSGSCVVISGALLVVGARQRARLPVKWWQIILGSVLAIAGCAVANSPLGFRAMQAIIVDSYSAAMAFATAVAIWPRNRALNAPEKAFFAILMLLGAFLTVLASAGSMLHDGVNDAYLNLYRMILGIGLPAIYVATGVTAVVVIAGDLASQLRALVSYDQLTGLLNRRGMEESAARAIAHAHRHGHRLAAVIADLDGFKTVNDKHGHIMGDAALRAFSRVLLGAIRKEDIAARLGGDEFCVLLLDASEKDAAEVMERVRAGVELLAIDRMTPGSISASFGVSALLETDTDLETLITRADHALYESKQKGRNRVTIWAIANDSDGPDVLDQAVA